MTAEALEAHDAVALDRGQAPDMEAALQQLEEAMEKDRLQREYSTAAATGLPSAAPILQRSKSDEPSRARDQRLSSGPWDIPAAPIMRKQSSTALPTRKPRMVLGRQPIRPKIQRRVVPVTHTLPAQHDDGVPPVFKAAERPSTVPHSSPGRSHRADPAPTSFSELSDSAIISDSVLAEYKQLRDEAERSPKQFTYASSLKSAKGIYAHTRSAKISLSRQKRLDEQTRSMANMWRARQVDAITALENQRVVFQEAMYKRSRIEERKAKELKMALGLQDVPARFHGAAQKIAEEAKFTKKESRPTVWQVEQTESQLFVAQKAANRAIRTRQDKEVQQKITMRNQQREMAELAEQQKAAQRKAAQEAVMKSIATRKSKRKDPRGAPSHTSQSQATSRIDDRHGNGVKPFSPASWGFAEAQPSKQWDVDLDRWRKRLGVPPGMPVFIADPYGEPVSRKLLERGWARNFTPSSLSCNFMFVRRGSDVPHNGLAPTQVANHCRGGDILTVKSGLHDCAQSLPRTVGLSTDSFYPRSYSFGSGGDKTQQMEAFIADFRECAAVAILRIAACSPDGRHIVHTDGESRAFIDLQLIELSLSHIRWKLCRRGLWDAADEISDPSSPGGRKPGTPGAASPSSVGSKEGAAPGSGRGSRTEAPLNSPLTDSQWDSIVQHHTTLNGVARFSHMPDLQKLYDELSGPDEPSNSWEALRRRVVVGLATLERVDPQTQINGPANAWVVKPCGAARGEGVKVVDSMDRILSELQTGPPRIVQKYVERPLLLGKTKADLRVWVVVLSFEPLVAYIYDQVMIRPASEAFTLVPDQLSNTAIHLCNHSVQGALSGKRQQVDKLGPRRPASRAGSPARRMRSPDPQADRPRTTKSRPESVYATSMFHSPLGKRSGQSISELLSETLPPPMGGTVVATIENGEVRYVSVGEGEGETSKLEQARHPKLSEQPPPDSRPGTASGAEMLSLRQMLPYIAASANPGGEDGGSSGPDEDPSAREHSPTDTADVGHAAVSPATPVPSQKRSADLWANGLMPAKSNTSQSPSPGDQGTVAPGNAGQKPASAAAKTLEIPAGAPRAGHQLSSPKSPGSGASPKSRTAGRFVPRTQSIHCDFMDRLRGPEGQGWKHWRESYLPSLRHAVFAILSSTSARRPQTAGRAPHSFELYGFDFILDYNGTRAWLLEVNESPDLRSHSPAKATACSDMLDDLLDLVTGHVPVPDNPEVVTPPLLPVSAWDEPPRNMGGWERLGDEPGDGMTASRGAGDVASFAARPPLPTAHLLNITGKRLQAPPGAPRALTSGGRQHRRPGQPPLPGRPGTAAT